MPSITRLLTYFRNELLLNPDVTGAGIDNTRIYKKMLSQTTEVTANNLPILTMSYDRDRTEIFADKVPVCLYMEIYTKDDSITDDLADSITAQFHRRTYKAPDGSLVINLCIDGGHRISPVYNKSINAWGTLISFEIKFG